MWFCLFRFAFTICPRVLSIHVFFVFVVCLFFLFMSVCVCLCHFICFILLLPFDLGFYLFLFFFLPFLLSHVANRVLVLWPGVGPETPRWESQVQDIGPPETSRPHIISISKRSLREFHLNTKTQLQPIASNLQCWMPHAKQLARQEHNPTH